MPLSSLLLSLLLVFAWGSDYIVGHYSVLSCPPFLFIFLRFASCAAIMIPMYRTPPVPLRSIFFLSSLFVVAHVGAWLCAIKIGLYLSVIAVIEVMSTPIAIFLASLLLKERVTKSALVSIFIATLGAIVVVGTPSTTIAHQHCQSISLGVLLAIIDTAAWSMYGVYVRKLSTDSQEEINHFALFAWVSLFGSLQALCIVMFIEIPFLYREYASLAINTSFVFALSHSVLITTMMEQLLFYYLLKKHSVKQIASLFPLAPVVTAFLGYIILGESITKATVIGGGLAITGTLSLILLGKDDKTAT